MRVKTKRLSLSTAGDDDIVDLTQQVAESVAKSGVKNGTATVFVTGSTAGVTTMEYEPGLEADVHKILRDLVPRETSWRHNATWGEGNGHSHLRSLIVGVSLTVPVVEGSLTLGTWQQIVLIDFDIKGRSRNVVVQVMGD